MSDVAPANRSLTVRYVPWNITTPAGTQQAAPLTTVAPVDDSILLDVRLRIPPGHWGLTGIRLDYSGNTILPWSNPAQFILGDDDAFDFEIGFEVGPTLKAVTYNTDVFNHTHFMLLKVTDLPAAAPKPVLLVPVTARGG